MKNWVCWCSSHHIQCTLVLLWIDELLLHISICSIRVNRCFIYESRKSLNWLFLCELDMVFLLNRLLSKVIHDWHCFIFFFLFCKFIFLYNVRSVWIRHVSCIVWGFFFSWKHESIWVFVLKRAYHPVLLCFGIIFIEEVLNFFTLGIEWTWIIHQQCVWSFSISIRLKDWLHRSLPMMWSYSR